MFSSLLWNAATQMITLRFAICFVIKNICSVVSPCTFCFANRSSANRKYNWSRKSNVDNKYNWNLKEKKRFFLLIWKTTLDYGRALDNTSHLFLTGPSRILEPTASFRCRLPSLNDIWCLSPLHYSCAPSSYYHTSTITKENYCHFFTFKRYT